MLSIKTVSNAGYYADLAHNDDYYHKGEEPAGQWHGSAAKEFGLNGTVNRQDFLFLCAGYSPTDKNAAEKLVRNAGITEGDAARRPGWDMCFSAPKSVSCLWSGSDDEIKERISKIQEKAVKATLDYAEQNYGQVRVGKTGRETEQTQKLFFALFEHSTSRAQDPQLHTHAVMINIGINPRGETRTLDSIEIHRSKMMLGAFYRAELARGLTEDLGVAIEEGKKGTFEITGVSKPLMEFWSKRREEIEEALKQAGYSSAKASAVATLNTRQAKEYPDRELLFAEWREKAKEFGFDHKAIINQASILPRTQEEKAAITAEAVNQMTQHKAAFSERDLQRAILEKAPVYGLKSAECLHMAIDWTESQGVELDQRNGQRIFTTKEIAQMEAEMVINVLSGRDYKARSFQANGFNKELSEEQRAAVDYITMTDGQFKAVSGMAGTGKTTMLKEAKRIWEAQGYEVQGVSLAAVAAKNLEKEAGIKSKTVAKLIWETGNGAGEGSKTAVKVSSLENQSGEPKALGVAKQLWQLRSEIVEEIKTEITGKTTQERAEEKQRAEIEQKQKQFERRQFARKIYAELKYATWQMDATTKKKYLGEYYKPTSKAYHEFLYATWQISKEHREHLNEELKRLKDGEKREFSVLGIKIINTDEMKPENIVKDFIAGKVAHQMQAERVFSKPALNEKTLLVIDEAGMVGTRQMAAIVAEAKKAGAKVVMVGDEKQLQPIEHGAPFKAIGDLMGKAELKDIRRQREEWAREAVIEFSEGQSAKGLQRYAEKGLLHLKDGRSELEKEVIQHFMKDPISESKKLLLGTTRNDVRKLNELAQQEMKKAGKLGKESIKVNGYSFHSGDRVLFTSYQKSLGLCNGDIGTIREVNVARNRMTVKLDSGELKTVPLNRYTSIELAYAVTTHRAQGKTVDNAYVLPGDSMQDRELTYVQMSRARGTTRVYATFDQMNAGDLATMMSRSNQKEMATMHRLNNPSKAMEAAPVQQRDHERGINH